MSEVIRCRWALAVAAVAVGVPLVIAVLAQRSPTWYPVFDLAMTELRVRDVGGPNTPLIGLQGRIGPTGSHPGPVSFYALAPVYRLLGSSSFALQAATALFQWTGAVVAIAVVSRRRDPRLVVGVTVVLLLLMRGYGLGPLTEPWNPHLPLLWFVAFLVVVWAVVDGDRAMLVPAVVTGSVCAQTHVPYLPVTVSLGVGAFVAATYGAWRHREGGGRWWAWPVAAAVAGLVLWAPPLVDEVRNDPGNLTQLVDHLGSPVEEPIGPGAAARLVFERLDAWQLVVVESAHPGTYIDVLGGPGPMRDRGAVALGAWVSCVALSAALRHRPLLRLHAVVAAAVVVGWVAISRIYGVPWHYLMLWGFAIGAVMLLAVVATVAVALARRFPRFPHHRAVLVGGSALAGVLAVQLVLLAPSASSGTPATTAQLGRLVDPTVDALERGDGAASGRSGRYLVQWSDATLGGSQGLGMVNELVRRGFDVGVEPEQRVRVPSWRVREDHEATARVVVASGGWIEQWAAQPGALVIAADDPRTPAERREFERLLGEAAELLHTTGRSDLAERVEKDLFGIALNERVDDRVHPLLGRLLDIGVDVAVIVLPAELP